MKHFLPYKKITNPPQFLRFKGVVVAAAVLEAGVAAGEDKGLAAEEGVAAEAVLEEATGLDLLVSALGMTAVAQAEISNGNERK